MKLFARSSLMQAYNVVEDNLGSAVCEEYSLGEGLAGSDPIAPITHVPDEILHEVFSMMAADAWECRASTPPWHNSNCLAVSHVCRYWRRRALAFPQMWSYLSITPHSSMDQLETYVQRSNEYPLHVQYTGSANIAKPYPSWGRKAVVLVDQSYRFAEFHVAELRREDVTDLLTLFRKPAPLLRRLSLHAPIQLLGPSVFSRDMPSLHNIELSGVLLAFLPYRNMDTMVLKDQLVPSLGKLLSTLNDCPKLRVLKLGLLGAMENAAVMGGMTSTGDPQPEMVHLPYLQDFSLSTMVATDMANILHHLTFPKTTTIDLKFYGHQNVPLDLANVCPSLAIIAAVQHNIILELIGAIEWSTYIVLRSADNKLRIEWEWYEAGGLPEILDSAGFSTISFPVLRHLTIFANSFRLPEAQWRQILARVPTVTTLELNVRDSMVLELFNALSRVVEAGSTDGVASRPVCPKMTGLKLSRLDEQLTILRGLAGAVEKRGVHGYHLRSLELVSRTGKPFPKEIENKLKQHVSTVVVKHDGPSMDYGSLSALLYD